MSNQKPQKMAITQFGRGVGPAILVGPARDQERNVKKLLSIGGNGGGRPNMASV